MPRGANIIRRTQSSPEPDAAALIRLVVVGVEELLRLLPGRRPRALRRPAQGADAAFLLELPHAEALCDGPVPELHEVRAAETRPGSGLLPGRAAPAPAAVGAPTKTFLCVKRRERKN